MSPLTLTDSNGNTTHTKAESKGTNGLKGTNGTISSPPSPFRILLRSLEDLERESFSNDAERIEALHAAYALVSRLETPWETIARLCMGQPALGASLKVAKDVGLFEKWHAQDDGPRGVKELSEMVGVESLLLERILRHLSSNHVLSEPSPGLYQQTHFSLSLNTPSFGEWINYLYDATIPCFHKMPEYLAKTGYKNPNDEHDGIFQYTTGFKGGLFQYYDANPDKGNTFNYVMSGVMATQASWLDIFPHQRFVEENSCPKCSPAADKDAAILVDVGGNVGHDLERFREAHPEVANKLVLQDRPDVVKNSTLPDPVVKMGHDFFTEQPVKGARAYYMHGVLHDWSDESCIKILEQLRPAMRPGHSTLLVHEHVIPETHPNPHATAYDLTMMVKVAGLERTETMWKKLLDTAGFKIVKIWRSPMAAQSVIEAEV
ncbi:S-adenosyl-L-methionine-dependent methyltransferase, partial [Delitschia confertaspora ATCC 74209]